MLNTRIIPMIFEKSVITNLTLFQAIVSVFVSVISNPLYTNNEIRVIIVIRKVRFKCVFFTVS